MVSRKFVSAISRLTGFVNHLDHLTPTVDAEPLHCRHSLPVAVKSWYCRHLPSACQQPFHDQPEQIVPQPRTALLTASVHRVNRDRSTLLEADVPTFRTDVERMMILTRKSAPAELKMLFMPPLIQLERIIYVLSNVFYKFSENNLESEMKLTMTVLCRISGRRRAPGIYHIFFAILN